MNNTQPTVIFEYIYRPLGKYPIWQGGNSGDLDQESDDKTNQNIRIYDIDVKLKGFYEPSGGF